jgi:DNA primase
MPGIDYRQARSRIRLTQVLELIGYRPCQRTGPQWRGPCPLHGSTSATSRCFAVHVGNNVYHCFRCQAAGNALDLWVAWTGQPLHAAVLDLCRRLGVDVPWLPSSGANRSAANRSAANAKEVNRKEKTMTDP